MRTAVGDSGFRSGRRWFLSLSIHPVPALFSGLIKGLQIQFKFFCWIRNCTPKFRADANARISEENKTVANWFSRTRQLTAGCFGDR